LRERALREQLSDKLKILQMARIESRKLVEEIISLRVLSEKAEIEFDHLSRHQCEPLSHYPLSNTVLILPGRVDKSYPKSLLPKFI
jgi:hypothetical protein